MPIRIRGTLGRHAGLVSGIIVLLAWYVTAETLQPQWLPTLQSVIHSAWNMVWSGSLSVLGTTGVTLVIGLAVMFVIAGVLSVIMTISSVVEESLLPFVNGFLATPHIALIPMFTFIWGNGDLTRVITTIAFAISPVTLTWLAALKSPPADLVDMARSFGAGPAARARYIRIPAAAAPLITGVRIGVVQGIKGVISAEVLIGVIGVGKIITTASQTFNIADLYAIVLIIIILSIACYLVLSSIEGRAIKWNT